MFFISRCAAPSILHNCSQQLSPSLLTNFKGNIGTERGCRKLREKTLLEPSNYCISKVQKRSGLRGTDLSSVFRGSGIWAHLGLHAGTNSPSSWPDNDSQSSPGFKHYDSLSPSVSVMNLLVWQLRPSFVYHGTEFSHIIRWKRSYRPWTFYFSNTVTLS